MTLAFDPSDEFFRRNQALLKMAEESRLIHEMMGGPFRAIEESMRPLASVMESLKRSFSITDEFRQQQEMMTQAMAPIRLVIESANQLHSIVAASEMKKVLSQQAEMMSVVSAEINALNNSTALQIQRSLESVLSAAAITNPILEAFQKIEIQEDLKRILQGFNASGQLAEAMTTSAVYTSFNDFDKINEAAFQTVLTEAIDQESKTSTLEGAADNLLAYVARIAANISSRFPDISLESLLANFVCQLLVSLIVLGISSSTSEHNYRAIHTQLDAIKHVLTEPKHFVAVDSINLREFGEKAARRIAKLPPGTEFIELDRSENGWRYLKSVNLTNVLEGWAYFRNLRPKE